MRRPIRRSAFWALVPLLVWNALFAGSLPAPYQDPGFSAVAPRWLLVLEAAARAVVFAWPVFLVRGSTSLRHRTGLRIFLVGAVIYLASWGPLLMAPDAPGSLHIVAFTAPAWTPSVWLVGLALWMEGPGDRRRYRPWMYLLPALLFVVVHVFHATWAYRASVSG